MKMPVLLLIALGAMSSIAVHAADKPATEPVTQPRAARSVHLSYISPPAVAFYAEVTVEKTVDDSYFQVCGFNGGYFGIQDHENGHRVGIFSVWDTAKGNDPKAVDQKDRVQTLFVGEGVRANRFGGEGTGGHSDFDFPWKVGQTYRFYLTAKIHGNSTAYAAYIFDPDKKTWMHVATFTAPDGGKKLTGLYSFIEDFHRNTHSATQVRRARYGNQWVQTADGKWTPITKAHFTASGAPWEAKDTINAGVEGNELFLQTGGDTVEETKLRDIVERPQTDANPPQVPGTDVEK
jgi:hypothetical protein